MELEKRMAVEYDQRVRAEAIRGCQLMKEVEQQLVRAPSPLLGMAAMTSGSGSGTHHAEAQAARASMVAAATAIVRSFTTVIHLLGGGGGGAFGDDAAVAAVPPMTLPPSSSASLLEQHQHHQHHHHSRGLMHAIAQLEAARTGSGTGTGTGGRSLSPNHPESPMSTAGNSETTPPPSPSRSMLSPRMATGNLSPRLPTLPSPPLSSSPCHTPVSAMSDGSPVTSFLGILDLEAPPSSSRAPGVAGDGDADAAGGAGGADHRPVPKRRYVGYKYVFVAMAACLDVAVPPQPTLMNNCRDEFIRCTWLVAQKVSAPMEHQIAGYRGRVGHRGAPGRWLHLAQVWPKGHSGLPFPQVSRPVSREHLEKACVLKHFENSVMNCIALLACNSC